jgi:hypothetical protein
MKNTFRQIFSLFVLFLFVFPFVQKEIHTFEHSHDFHCTSKTERHFHAEQHHCLVCEYNILLGEISKQSIFKVKLAALFIDTISFYKECYFFNHAFSFSLRAPPSL